MECPVPCYICGELIELDAAHFNTEYCGCPEGCTHGVCEECFQQLVDPDDVYRN